jgi:uncharacterized glyoxalase superfamily metalloenzyme YdcJ
VEGADVTVQTWELRAAFAVSLSTMYGTEVPAYDTLVEVAGQVNADVLAAAGDAAERLGSIERVTAERHGAIRVGTASEMRAAATVFGALGMYPVGFYDLRDAAASAVPVISTAFRPIDADELARNPFRVFTSLLAVDDRRFFDPELQERLTAFLSARELFSTELLDLAERATVQAGLPEADAERFLQLATDVFRLSDEPVDRDWYRTLEAISSVAADIGGVASTHINHLTPRVLDIDALYRRMSERGITMIDDIQGPPRWDGPDVLLRQTSFKALAEPRRFREADGTQIRESLRVRFGEVEARGIALTVAGREIYDRAMGEIDRRLAETTGASRQEIGAQVWAEHFPRTEAELDRRGLGFFSYRPAPVLPPGPAPADLDGLVAGGWLVADPIVYEDFLPRSAAGIFQSNLSGAGTKDEDMAGDGKDLAWMSGVVGRAVAEPTDLYAAQRDASLRAAESGLGLPTGSLHPRDAGTDLSPAGTAGP